MNAEDEKTEEQQMELGKKIASLRKQNKITQAQLAEYLAIQPQTVSRWEADGGTPDVMLLPKIAMFFGVSLDELFGMNDMEQIENLVYKYSVLRDEKTFDEVMRKIEGAIEALEEQAQDSDEEGHECIKQREQLLAWKVHLYIQKSRKALEDAREQLDELLEEVSEEENRLYWPLRLQKQQLRIQTGEAKKAVQEAKESWGQDKNLNTLYCYLMGLLEMQCGEEILQLWECDEVQNLVEVVTEQTEPHWLAMFAAMRIEPRMEDFRQNLGMFEKSASIEALFDAEWELFLSFEELGLQQEKQTCAEKLLEKIEQMNLNEYSKDAYLKKINGL